MMGLARATADVESVVVPERLLRIAPPFVARVASTASGLATSQGLFRACESAVVGAVSLGGADFGNLQLVDPATGLLRIAAGG